MDPKKLKIHKPEGFLVAVTVDAVKCPTCGHETPADVSGHPYFVEDKIALRCGYTHCRSVRKVAWDVIEDPEGVIHA